MKLQILISVIAIILANATATNVRSVNSDVCSKIVDAPRCKPCKIPSIQPPCVLSGLHTACTDTNQVDAEKKCQNIGFENGSCIGFTVSLGTLASGPAGACIKYICGGKFNGTRLYLATSRCECSDYQKNDNIYDTTKILQEHADAILALQAMMRSMCGKN